MQSDVRIGEQRVLASGNLLLGPTEREVTFTLEGMSYVMISTPTADRRPPTADRRSPTPVRARSGSTAATRPTCTWRPAGISRRRRLRM